MSVGALSFRTHKRHMVMKAPTKQLSMIVKQHAPALFLLVQANLHHFGLKCAGFGCFWPVQALAVLPPDTPTGQGPCPCCPTWGANCWPQNCIWGAYTPTNTTQTGQWQLSRCLSCEMGLHPKPPCSLRWWGTSYARRPANVAAFKPHNISGPSSSMCP